MKYFLLLALIPLEAFAFNDWMIQCRGVSDDAKIFHISDERILGNRNNRTVKISRWSSRREMDWSLGGRLYVENKSVRDEFFFIEGKRVDYLLNYLPGFTRLPSEEQVDMNVSNSHLQLDFHEGISSSSPIRESVEVELACYYRKGGE